MKYTVYKTTNIINNKIYIGTHQTTNPYDSYLGSGNLIRRAIKKYGEKSFRKEIIEVFDNSNDMFMLERDLVNEEFIKRKDTYNLSVGGNGGNKLPKNHWTNDPAHLKSISPFTTDPIRAKEIASRGLANARLIWKKMVKARGGLWYSNNGFAGKRHSDDTKDKMSKSHQGKHNGKKNSQYGTCWVFSTEECASIKIKKHELDNYISKGWQSGRRMSF